MSNFFLQNLERSGQNEFKLWKVGQCLSDYEFDLLINYYKRSRHLPFVFANQHGKWIFIN